MSALTQRILALLAQSLALALIVAALNHGLGADHGFGSSFLSAFCALLLLGGLHLRQAWLQREAKHTLHSALERAGLSLLLLDAERGVHHANASFLALDERNREARSLPHFGVAWLHPLERHFSQAMGSKGQSEPEEVLLKPDDGREAMLLRLCATRVSDSRGEPCVLISAENLSAHNQTLAAAIAREHALHTRSQRYVQTLIDVIPQPVYVKDEEGRFVLVNQSFCARHNLTAGELIGQARQVLDADILRAEDALHEDLRVMAGTPIFREEHLRKNEQDLYFIISKQSCEDPEGRRVLVGTQVDITPWRTAEQAVKDALERETERRERTQAFFQRLIDVLPYPVSIKNAESRYLMVNEAFAQRRGMHRDALINLTPHAVIAAVIPQDSPYRAVALHHASLGQEEDRQVLAGLHLRKEENRLTGPNGESRDQIVTKTACEDPDGQRVIVVSTFDITELRNAQRELRAALDAEHGRAERIQAFLQRLLDVIPEPVYVKDAEARYIMINEAFASQRQQTAAEILGKTARELAPSPEVAARVLAEDEEVLAGRIIRNIDDTPHPLTGQARWRLITKGSCLDPEGRPVIIGANFDITAVREVERQLAASLAAEKDLRSRTQDFIQRLIDAIPIPIGVRDAASRHMHVNAAFLSDAGLAREQIIGQRMSDFLTDPLQIESSLREDQAVLAGQDLFEEKQDLGFSGQDIRDLIVSKRRCLDVDGQPVLVVAQIDVSLQREAERQALALMANEKSLRQRTQAFVQRMIDVIPHPFFIKDQAGCYVLVNQALLDELQLDSGALIGRHTLDIAASPDATRVIIEEEQRVLAGQDISEERHEQPLNGCGPWADRIISKRRCLDVDGKPVIAVLHLDITEHRRIERALQEALQREAALLGRMQDFLQHVIDVLPQEFYIKDADSRVMMVNPAYLARRGLLDAAEALGKTGPQLGADFLERHPRLQADPALLAQAREALQQRWAEARSEDQEVLAGKTILKKVARSLPGCYDEHVVVIAKAGCLDPQGRPVIVCASYDLTELDTRSRAGDPPAATARDT
ncbi:PAS domain-containing protein [Uliginosibacterium sp. 31-12]|uniref:PAS domain-containing protein n=1 Tax=Uliginosibacterium sp. 31-12 TaxID=3062781 RepID=UPI0026E281CD|nr:PAS domain-containing protein [Uliginosibacterium sp. 31-12]MDO6385894.1 PAS domain-containing protein [Uliginosibacterium sp. 31-12]